MAVLGSLLTTRYASGVVPAIESLPATSRATAEGGLAGALEVARDLPADAGTALVDTARAAFVDGFAQAGLASALLAVAVALAALVLLPREAAAPAGEEATEDDRVEHLADRVVDVRPTDACGAGAGAGAAVSER